MNPYLKKSVYFILIVIILSNIFQYVIDEGLKKSNYSSAYKEWYNLYQSEINAEILIQGSSRARIQISPKDIENNFKLSTYNLGIDGSTFPLENYRFGEYIKYNKKPRYIIQVIDANIFNNYKELDERQFLPYLNDKLIKEFSQGSVIERISSYIPLYKYIHHFGAVDAGIANYLNDNVKQNGNYNGYRSFDRNYDDTELRKVLKDYPKGFSASINQSVWDEFRSFLNFCKRENIKVMLVYTPVLSAYQNMIMNKETITNKFAKVANGYDVIYLDYSKDAICSDRNLFFDYFHLNTKGVEIFNKILIKDLANHIN